MFLTIFLIVFLKCHIIRSLNNYPISECYNEDILKEIQTSFIPRTISAFIDLIERIEVNSQDEVSLSVFTQRLFHG